MNFRHTQQEGTYTWYLKPSQLPQASEVKDFRGESTSSHFTNWHNSRLCSNIIFIATEKCSSHLSTKKLLFVTDGGCYIKLQLIKMQCTSDGVVPSSNWFIYHKTPAYEAQETCQKCWWRDCKSTNNGMSSVWLCLLEMSATLPSWSLTRMGS